MNDRLTVECRVNGQRIASTVQVGRHVPFREAERIAWRDMDTYIARTFGESASVTGRCVRWKTHAGEPLAGGWERGP